MTRQVCPSCGLDELADIIDASKPALRCNDCDYTWNPTPTTDSTGPWGNAIHASSVGKLLRAVGLHREYGQNGPDRTEDGGPGFAARGSAKARNAPDYEQGRKIVYVKCDDDRTVTLVRQEVEANYGDVIKEQVGNVLFLERF